MSTFDTEFYEISSDKLRELIAKGMVRISKEANQELITKQGDIVIEVRKEADSDSNNAELELKPPQAITNGVGKEVASGIIVSILTSKAGLIAAGIAVAPFLIAGASYLVARAICGEESSENVQDALDPYEKFMP